VDVRLDEVVIRTLEKEPERRYQQVSEVKSQVESITGTGVPVNAAGTGSVQAGRMTLTPEAKVKYAARNAGVGMMVGGILLIFWAFLGATMEILRVMKYQSPPMTEFTFMVLLTVAGIGGMAIAGGVLFKRIVNYAFVKWSSIILLLTPVLLIFLKGQLREEMLMPCLLTLMFSIPALVHLAKPEIKQAFGVSDEPDAGMSAADLARREVKGPATGLIITAVVNWLSLFVILFFMFFKKNQNLQLPFLPFLVGTILTAGSALILVGALKMKRMEMYGMAKLASILSIVIGPGYIIGLPVGIWSLVTLSSPAVKAGFGIAVPPKDDTPPPTGIGKISLWFAIVGIVLPIILAMLLYVFRNQLKIDDVIPFVACWLLGVVLELVALGCGIAARRTATGKAGIIISVISLVVSVLVYLAVFAVSMAPVETSSSQGPHEERGPVSSFMSEVMSSTKSATIVEAPDPADDPKETHFRNFRYRIFAPTDYRVSLWLEYWSEGKKVTDQTWNRGQSYVPGKGKAIDGFFEFSLAEGKKLSPEAVGKVRWGWKMQLPNGSPSSGEWAPDPFYGGSSSFSSTWGKEKKWDIESGKPYTLLAMVGSKGEGHFTTDKDREKFSSICILLRVRIDPAGDRKDSSEWGGYFNDPDQFFKSAAVQTLSSQASREEHGPVSGFVRELTTSETKATILEAPDPADDPIQKLYRAFRYRIFAPADYRVSLWLEHWSEGKKISDKQWNHGRSYIPQRGKAIDGFFQFMIKDGKKMSPDAEGKVLWLWDGPVNWNSQNSGWATNLFYLASYTSTWGLGPKKWDLIPGKPSTLLAIVGGKGEEAQKGFATFITADPDSAKNCQIGVLLRARIDPVDWTKEKGNSSGNFTDPDQFFKPEAGKK
jgi:hypothetical protein